MADNEGREPPKAAPPSLSCSEVHEGQGKPTVLLVHGASSSGSNSWATVASHLDAYHLLLPDLPAHGKSKNILPFSKELSARLLANLIRSKATSGIAHIVGHSLGSHIAMELAFKYPEVVVTVFVSGFGVFSSPKALAYGLYLQNSLQSAVPDPVVRWLTDGTDFPPHKTANSLPLCKDLAKAMCFGDDGWPKPWPARTLIVAAGKSGILPTSDSAENAKRLRDIGIKLNEATVAYTHPAMRHAWTLQDSELFARTTRQWIEEGSVPDGFKIL
ncbi:hypothetical protein LTR09_003414 [Extremus antarcticus]|uniref:AB hydrolase-1 domain-containing protein n=1 Tax=Extremus antarcticus TaxID=702011 RepID=A0AAJ0DJT1_9PEZI|nr:hypothetical protein LTR09_003414 [Extremus antarcticus]